MKAIINGFRYDTDKAILVGEGGSSGYVSRGDYSYWSAKLYRTPRANRFFLAGHGGPMTRWAHAIGNNGRVGSSGIIPLDAAKALEWAEKYLSVEQIETHFAKMVQEA